MSAFVVGHNHINSIVNWAVNHQVIERQQANEVGQLLWNENVKAVNYRYKEKDKAEKFEWLPMKARRLTQLEVLKACMCLEYQCDEHPKWKSSKAKQWIQDIKDQAIRKLPGYDQAVYAID